MLAAPTTQESLSVLMAEGNEDTRRMYGEFLRHSGIDLDEAADGREALAKALATPHDLILTGTRLPGINGYQLCELLRRDSATTDTPIIVLTADASAAEIDHARRAGADAVLVKPCLPDALLREIRIVRRRSEELRRESAELRRESAELRRESAELRRESAVLGERAMIQVARARQLQANALAFVRSRALSRSFIREDTTTPPQPPPQLVCPGCDQPLTYQHSHVGGVSERHREQWDYFECLNGCGRFQYRQRTRKLRRL